jgi:hypothetical protein
MAWKTSFYFNPCARKIKIPRCLLLSGLQRWAIQEVNDIGLQRQNKQARRHSTLTARQSCTFRTAINMEGLYNCTFKVFETNQSLYCSVGGRPRSLWLLSVSLWMASMWRSQALISQRVKLTRVAKNSAKSTKPAERLRMYRFDSGDVNTLRPAQIRAFVWSPHSLELCFHTWPGNKSEHRKSTISGNEDTICVYITDINLSSSPRCW